ncbi:MAG TPA: ribosome maturation factor RimM [Phototrophicaceae bacterium]|nr:ribosome maturation factor RimM [Phototrophicaceae bacterium]
MNTPNANNRGPQRPPYLLIGEILRPHGIAGELRTRILTAYPERLAELKTIYLGSNAEASDIKPYSLQGVRFHQGYALLKLKGVNDRSQAEIFRQLFVMVAIDDAVPLEAGEVYLYQLIGMQVQTEAGDILGEITEVLETGANDVYIVASPQYGEVLIPATAETILETNAENRRVTVRLPEGLLPNP